MPLDHKMIINSFSNVGIAVKKIIEALIDYKRVTLITTDSLYAAINYIEYRLQPIT